jgi:predicted RNase H-like HicB family nuclease
MNLLREIQNAAIDSNTDLPSLLRRCQVLAFRLDYEPLKNWVNYELNGYPEGIEIPDYRIIRGLQSYGTFINTAWKYSNVAIPISIVPEEYQEDFTRVFFRQSIAFVSSLVDLSEQNSLKIAWPPEFTEFISQNYYVNMECLEAWKQVSTSSIIELLDAVQNRILSFSLELEQINPQAGEANPETQPVPKETVHTIFVNTINGGLTVGNQTHIRDIQGSNLNIDSYLSNVSQTIQTIPDASQETKNVLTGAIEELHAELQKVPSEQASEAGTILERVDALAKEASNPKPDQTIIHANAESLKKAAENLGQVTPIILPIAMRIIESINNLAN